MVLVEAQFSVDERGSLDRPCTDVHKEVMVNRPEEAATTKDNSRPPGRSIEI